MADSLQFPDTPFNPAAFGSWVVAFVRHSNRLAGITREPTPAEIGAHRGLLAAKTLRVENLELFVRHVESSAKLRADDAGGHCPASGASEMRADLETLVLAAQERLWSPPRLHDVYMRLRPFTDANGRSGRVFWLWQHIRSPAGRGVSPSETEIRFAIC